MSFRIRPRGRQRVRSRGQSLVEFALVLPIMLILLAAAIDLGRLFYAYVAVENAAKEGAFFGSRNPLCDDSGNPNCLNPNNVIWHVQNEATNIGSQFSTNVSCWTPAGALVQPINDCLDGYTYRVTVSYPFRLLTPILGSIVNQNLTLTSESQATVISDAFDPTGLEVLVWVNNTNAINGPAIATACTQADVTSSPNFYYAPCQDSLNVPNYLQFAEASTVSYKVRVRNTGNTGITGISYGWQENGGSMSSPGNCNTLPTALAAGASPAFCTFTKAALASNPVNDIADHVITVNAQGSVGAVSTGQTNGTALIKVLAVPKLTVNLRASPYRLGGDGDGLLGNPQYVNGNLTLNRNTSATLPDEIQDPTGWFYLTIANSGGTARNFALTVTQQGTPITLPCTVPTQLAATGGTFTCLFPRTFDQTQAYPFAATATADNSIIVAGSQTNVTVTTATCPTGQRVIPNLIDELDPNPNGNNKTVGQAKALWTAATFTSTPSTQPNGASNSLDAITQNRTAYTCSNNANLSVQIGAQ